MNIVCLVQARMTSTRLPGKVMLKVRNIPMIGYLLHSLEKTSLIDNTVVITTTNHQDDVLVEYLKKNNHEYFRGSESDVLERYVLASEKYNADLVVRITADCPLIDPEIVDTVVKKSIDSNTDYTSNTIIRTYPDGYDVEVIKKTILDKINGVLLKQDDREHVTRHILNNLAKFSVTNVEAPSGRQHPEWRITLDHKEDFILIKEILESFPREYVIKYNDIINLFTKNPELIYINSALSTYKKC